MYFIWIWLGSRALGDRRTSLPQAFQRILEIWLAFQVSTHSTLGRVIQLTQAKGVALGTIFTVFTSVSGGIILAHVIAWKIAIVLLAAVPIMLASGYIRLRMLAKSETRHRSAYSDATGLAIEACRSRKTVTILGLEEFILNRYHDSLQKRHKEGYSFTFFCNTLLAFSLAITYFVYALAYWW